MITVGEAVVTFDLTLVGCNGGEAFLLICMLEAVADPSTADVDNTGIVGVVVIKAGFNNELDGEGVKRPRSGMCSLKDDFTVTSPTCFDTTGDEETTLII